MGRKTTNRLRAIETGAAVPPSSVVAGRKTTNRLRAIETCPWWRRCLRHARRRKTTNRLRAIETRDDASGGVHMGDRVARQLIAFGRLKLVIVTSTGCPGWGSQDN